MSRGITSAAATLFALFAMSFAGPLHLMIQPHTLCPIDGQLIHADYLDVGESAEAHDHGPDAGLAHGEPQGAPTPTPQPAPIDHTHDQPCALALQLNAPGGSASALPVPHADPRDVAATATTAAALPHQSIPALTLAPSHSPPA